MKSAHLKVYCSDDYIHLIDIDYPVNHWLVNSQISMLKEHGLSIYKLTNGNTLEEFLYYPYHSIKKIVLVEYDK